MSTVETIIEKILREMTMIKLYTVNADYSTGEWLGEAEDAGKMVDWNAHLAQPDTDESHFDTYEAPIFDQTGWDTGETETRAITVRWVKE